MKIVVIIASVLALAGCASKCVSHCVFGFGPGSDAFVAVAKHYDNRDPCILAGKPAGTVRADFCGASNNKIVHITKGVGDTYIIKQK